MEVENIRLVQEELDLHFAMQSWPQFIVSRESDIRPPRFCPESCEGDHICHLRKDQYWLVFQDGSGQQRVRYRYVGRDESETLWELSPASQMTT